MRLRRPRLFPVLAAATLAVAVVKADLLWRAAAPPARAASPGTPSAGPASSGTSTAPPAAAAESRRTAPSNATPPAPSDPPPSPAEAAEREILTALRARRAEIEAREAALAAREAVFAAAERRLTARLDDLAALQARLEAADRARAEREETGWRGLVRTYETMRPRDAAAVFDDLELPVLVGIVARMREAKAAPILGAMRPDRARSLTAELSRHRAGAEVPR
ncbi:MotE family protein [Roseomonas sp. CCTCC AB2023176]|uniref:MotE family protein n=1 Tax=Roseomonas sp. CCTCC AB2023176 TaxID=3342640 RepID=UPI0035D9EDA7